jgi:predicted transcriptional regulator
VDKKKKTMRNFAIALLLSLSMTSFSSSSYVKGINSTNEPNKVLTQETRNFIYKYIENNPGIHFRKICRDVGKKMGVVQYHLSVLEKNGLVRIVKDGRYKCFFTTRKNSLDYRPEDDLTREQRELRESVLTNMKRKTPEKIFKNLLENEKTTHQTLAKICEVTPQAITFHTKRLEGLGLIISSKMGRQKVYSISDQVSLIKKYL